MSRFSDGGPWQGNSGGGDGGGDDEDDDKDGALELGADSLKRLRRRYAWEHFRETSDTHAFYSLPKSQVHLRTLADAVAPRKRAVTTDSLQLLRGSQSSVTDSCDRSLESDFDNDPSSSARSSGEFAKAGDIDCPLFLFQLLTQNPRSFRTARTDAARNIAAQALIVVKHSAQTVDHQSQCILVAVTPDYCSSDEGVVPRRNCACVG